MVLTTFLFEVIAFLAVLICRTFFICDIVCIFSSLKFCLCAHIFVYVGPSFSIYFHCYKYGKSASYHLLTFTPTWQSLKFFHEKLIEKNIISGYLDVVLVLGLSMFKQRTVLGMILYTLYLTGANKEHHYHL